jgi:chaperone required for assembly of F1-ATPase
VEAVDGGFAVTLDGKRAKTPGRRVLQVEDRELAKAVAAEWAAQTDEINPTTMPLTRIVNSAIDGVAERADAVRDEIVTYAGSDLLCYRAGGPAALIAKQADAWDPILAWAERTIGGRFVLGEGVMHVAQPEETLAKIAGAFAPIMPLPLAALHVITTLTGSAILALAVLRGRLSAEDAWRAAHVDEDWQIAQWGEDREASLRRAARWTDMEAAVRILRLAAPV